MRKSEIFEAFLKIAEEKGMLDVEKANQKAKDALKKNPRWDSRSEKEIAELYNQKPKASPGMEYKRNIIELAHPESVVVSPAYDRLNGLVENENERQDISINLINRRTRGLNTNHKNAQQELVWSLIRTANGLDNLENEELRILADHCLAQVLEKAGMKKTAALPLAGLLSPWMLVPAFFGALYWQQHKDAADEGFEVNHHKLIAELDDFLNSNSNFGVGQTYKPQFLEMVKDFKQKLENFYSLYEKASSLINELDRPHSTQEAMEAAKKFSNSAPQKAYEALKQGSVDLLRYMDKIKSQFADSGYKARQIQEKGFFTSLIDRVPGLHGGSGLVSDDFDDVRQIIPAYIDSLKEVADLLKKSGEFETAMKRDLAKGEETQKTVFDSAPKEEKNDGGMLKNVDDKAEKLMDELENGWQSV